MGRPRRRGWEQVVEAYRRSGQTRRAFAATRGMSVGTLYKWVRRWSHERPEPRLLPVRVVAAPAVPVLSMMEPPSIEVVLPRGLRVLAPVHATTAAIVALVRGLE